MILGCIAAAALLYFTKLAAKPFYEYVLKPLCNLFVDLMKTIWEGLKFVGRAIEEGCRKAVNVLTFSGFDQIDTTKEVKDASVRI